MLVDWLPDQRFDRPALHSLVDLINHTYGLQLPYTAVEVEAVDPPPSEDLSTVDILRRASYPTRAQLRLTATQQTVEVSYHRLLLPAYLYRHALMKPAPALPMLVTDRFITEQHIAETDALAYLRREHRVWLEPDECVVESRTDQPALDGTWPVVITPRADHLLWVGPVVLHAQLPSVEP